MKTKCIFTRCIFLRFLQDFTWPDAINCLFSFWGFYGVYLFIFLSGYGLTKSFANRHTERNIRFIGRHIVKIYLLFLCSVGLYLVIVPKVNYKAVLYVLSLTTNLSPETLFLVCGPWWFFSLIIQLYLLFLFLYKFIQKDISNIVLICFSYLLIALYWMKYCGTGIGLYANAIGHIPEFSLGIFVAIYEKWLGINYVFAYTAYKLCCFIHNLRRSS